MGGLQLRLSKRMIWVISTIFIVVIIVISNLFIYQYFEIQKKNDQISLTYQKQFNLPKAEIDNLYSKYKDWNLVNQKILEQKCVFSSEKLTEFSSKGFPQADIVKAQSYASRCNYTAEQILKDRGLPGKKQVSWSKVIKKLNIDTRSESEFLGLTKGDKLILKQFNLSEPELVNIAVLKLQKKHTVDEIFNQLKLGKSVEQIVAEK